jgi:hypothetical protein
MLILVKMKKNTPKTAIPRLDFRSKRGIDCYLFYFVNLGISTKTQD